MIMTETIVIAIFTTLAALGGGAFVYLKNQISDIKKENRLYRLENKFLRSLLRRIANVILREDNLSSHGQRDIDSIFKDLDQYDEKEVRKAVSANNNFETEFSNG